MKLRFKRSYNLFVSLERIDRGLGGWDEKIRGAEEASSEAPRGIRLPEFGGLPNRLSGLKTATAMLLRSLSVVLPGLYLQLD